MLILPSNCFIHYLCCIHNNINFLIKTIMKTSFKWFSALFLLVMGAFMFAACGDDDDENGNAGTPGAFPTLAQLYGTWEIIESPFQDNGPVTGTLVYIANDGKIKMKYKGQIVNGTYTYDVNTGKFVTNMPEPVGKGTSYLTLMSLDKMSLVTKGDEDKDVTVIIKKLASEDTIDEDSGGEGGEWSQDVLVSGLAGTWTVLANDTEAMTGKSITFEENGTGSYDGKWFHYSNESGDKGRIEFDLYFQDNSHIHFKFISVQEGNVLTGESDDDNGITLLRQGYTIPSEGILGRWQVHDHNMGDHGPTLGRIIVFANNGEMYIEGDPHYDSYEWKPSERKLTLYIGDETMIGTLDGGFATGDYAVFNMGNDTDSPYVKIKKL